MRVFHGGTTGFARGAPSIAGIKVSKTFTTVSRFFANKDTISSFLGASLGFFHFI
jgi:hypothetical protein